MRFSRLLEVSPKDCHGLGGYGGSLMLDSDVARFFLVQPSETSITNIAAHPLERGVIYDTIAVTKVTCG
jgi:hypothetical protein